MPIHFGMSISSIGGVSGFQPPPRNDHMHKTMEAAAKTLALSDDELRSKLQSGSTLADVASEQGVSKDDLIASIADTVKSTQLPGGVDATTFATQLVDRKPPSVSTLADALGVDSDTLVQQFESGDISDLLASFKSKYSQTASLFSGLHVDQYA